MTKGLPMKPSPMLEDTAKLKEYCAWILRSASETAPASCVARAYLALISAQPGVSPGGEGVTREAEREGVIKLIRDFIVGVVGSEAIPLEWIGKLADAIMELLRPTSPDPARATEEREGK